MPIDWDFDLGSVVVRSLGLTALTIYRRVTDDRPSTALYRLARLLRRLCGLTGGDVGVAGLDTDATGGRDLGIGEVALAVGQRPSRTFRVGLGQFNVGSSMAALGACSA